jgi:hypothetical protein
LRLSAQSEQQRSGDGHAIRRLKNKYFSVQREMRQWCENDQETGHHALDHHQTVGVKGGTYMHTTSKNIAMTG